VTKEQHRRQARQRVAKELDRIADTLDDPPASAPISQADVQRAAVTATHNASRTIYEAGAAAFTELVRKEQSAVVG